MESLQNQNLNFGKKVKLKLRLTKNGKGGFEAFYYSYKHSLKFYPDYTLQTEYLGDF